MTERILVVAGALAVLLGLSAAGCVDVDAKMDLGGPSGKDIEAVDVPQTSSHADCRTELREAYRKIQILKRDNERLRHKIKDLEKDKDELKDRCERYKEERDEYKKRYKKLTDD